MKNIVENYCELPTAVRRPMWQIWHKVMIMFDKDITANFMNYGYDKLNGETPLYMLKNDEKDRYCIQLYNHVASTADMKDKDVVEIGSGRGGGASFLSRYYDPKLGRWFTPDPAGQGFSPYSYCFNSPLMYVDPDGEFIFEAIMIGSAIYHGIKGYQETGSWYGAYRGAFMGAWAAGATMASFNPAMGSVSSTTLALAATSSISSVSIGYLLTGTANPPTTNLGIGSYDWGNKEWNWANPFNTKDTFVDNVFDVLGWVGFYDDMQKLDYYLTTTPEQRVIREKLKEQEGIKRGILDPFENSSPMEYLPEDEYNRLQEYLSHFPSGPHTVSKRYKGGLHWGLDKVKGLKTKVPQFHVDACDALAFGGLGVIGHGVEVFLHGTTYTPNFARLLRPWLPTVYRYRFLNY